MNQISLSEAINAIGLYLKLPTEDLMTHALLDEIGGYHNDPNQATFSMGSIWGVEGQVLYALIRVLRPLRVLELGTFNGCSTAHIIAALEANRDDYGDDVRLVTVDNSEAGGNPKLDCDFLQMVSGDVIDYLINEVEPFDLLFEDSKHVTAFVQAIYERALPLANPGAVLISHDAAHFMVGNAVLQGIRNAGIEPIVVLPEPSDCGLSVYRTQQENGYTRASEGTWSEQTGQWGEVEFVEDGGVQVMPDDDFDDVMDDQTEQMPSFDPVTFQDEIETDVQPAFQYSLDDLQSMSKAELIEELEALAIDPNTIEGSGSSGNILKDDLISALTEALKQ